MVINWNWTGKALKLSALQIILIASIEIGFKIRIYCHTLSKMRRHRIYDRTRARERERGRNKPKIKKKLAGVVHFFFWLFIMYEIRNDTFDPLPISVCCTVIIICKYIRLHIGTGFHIGRRMVIHKIKYKRSYIIHFYKLDSSTKHAVLWFKWISYSFLVRFGSLSSGKIQFKTNHTHTFIQRPSSSHSTSSSS